MAGDGRIIDPADFEAAFQQHFPPVYRFIARRVGPALAEDLAAETFATAYRRRATFDPGRASLRSWLYGIAANLVRNHWRAEQHGPGTRWPGAHAMRPRHPARHERLAHLHPLRAELR